MSDDDRDIDIESDDENDSDNGHMSQRHTSSQNFKASGYGDAEKRAHHNALERKRRDHIKESFTSLREAVPFLKGEKASRAQILKKTTECIQIMRRKIQSNQKDVEDIKKQTAMLEAQIRMLENAKNGYMIDSTEYQQLPQTDQSLQQDSDAEEQDYSRRSKKMKTSCNTA